MWVLYALGSAVFAGLTAILAKIGMQDTDSHLGTALRTVVVLVFSWMMVFVKGGYQPLGEIPAKTLLFLIVSGVCTGASWLCYFKALQLGDVNKVTPIDKSSTIMTMGLAMIFLGEPATAFKVGCIAVIGVGTWMMIEKKEAMSAGTPDAGNAWLWYAFGSAVFASLTAIFGKVGIRDINSDLGTALRTGVVLVMAWLLVFLLGKQKEITRIKKKSWWFILFSGIATGLSWLCYYRALQDGPASVVVPIDKLSIVLTVAFAWVVFGERLSKRAFGGLVLIVAGTLGLLL